MVQVPCRLEIDSERLLDDQANEAGLDPSLVEPGSAELRGDVLEQLGRGGEIEDSVALRPVRGVQLLEALAQLGGVALLSAERYAGRLPLFGGIDKARFRRQVVPGDTLELEVSLDRLGGSAGRGHGTARVSGELACEASMLFVIVAA